MSGILNFGIRDISGSGIWCIYCNCFIGEHERLCPYAALAASQERVRELESACADALGDLEWVEKSAQGSNFQASIVKLRVAIGRVPDPHSGEARDERQK